MLNEKYSGVNDGKPYPVDMVAFKDGDSVSNLNVENGELKLNGEPVGGGSGGALFVELDWENWVVKTPVNTIVDTIKRRGDIYSDGTFCVLRFETTWFGETEDDFEYIILSGLSTMNNHVEQIKIYPDGSFESTTYDIELTLGR